MADKTLINEFNDLLEKLQNMIQSEFSSETNIEWLKEIVDKEMYQRIRMRVMKDKVDLADAYTYLTLGQCISIFERQKEKLYKYFISDDFGFENKSAVKNALNLINKVRNTTIHGKESEVRKIDLDRLRLYLRLLNASIKEYFLKNKLK